MKCRLDRAASDHRALQLNPEHPAYHRSRGLDPVAAEHAALAVRQQHALAAAAPELPSSSTPKRTRAAR